MSRTRISIGTPIYTRDGVQVRPVEVVEHGQQFSARCYFRKVNGLGVYSIGECSDEAFVHICDALEKKGAKALAGMLQ